MMSCSSPRNTAAWWKGSNTALWLCSAEKPHFDCITGCSSDNLLIVELMKINGFKFNDLVSPTISLGETLSTFTVRKKLCFTLRRQIKSNL